MLMTGLHFLLPVTRLTGFPYSCLGVPAILVSVGLSVWAERFFKRAGTTVKPFEPSSNLVAEGPYRFSRHPMYLGMTMTLAGLAVLLGSLSPLAVVAGFTLLIDRRFIVAEERMMEETFGGAYREYRKRVRRWL